MHCNIGTKKSLANKLELVAILAIFFIISIDNKRRNLP